MNFRFVEDGVSGNANGIYCKPTVIRGREIFARSSSLRKFIAANQLFRMDVKTS